MKSVLYLRIPVILTGTENYRTEAVDRRAIGERQWRLESPKARLIYSSGALMSIAVDLVARRRVLVVDDEPTIAHTLAIIFTQAGYEVRTAYSAESAIEMTVNWVPELAILDVFLPGMHGVDLAIRFKGTHPMCRILLFSGQPASADILAQVAEQGHTFEILPKPVYPEVLLRRSATLLAAEEAQA